MGSEGAESYAGDGEAPVRRVGVGAFLISRTEITVGQFARFSAATGYLSRAEAEFGWSFCFEPHLPPAASPSHHALAAPWWVPVANASWWQPEGPIGDSIFDKAKDAEDEGESERRKRLMEMPVVHVSWFDAVAYCEWTGGRLPSEAEWEYAARGGRAGRKYCWGDALLSREGAHRCNIFQGEFPSADSAADGHAGRAPVGSYPANGYGLYDMCGNVWEWTADWHSPRRFEQPATEESEGDEGRNRGEERDALPLINFTGPSSGVERVKKGGSFLCTKERCHRYRPAARSSNSPDSSSANVGFRCVSDP